MGPRCAVTASRARSAVPPLALLLLAPAVSGINVTISNVIPRRATDGAIMDAHDGNIFLDAATGLYVWIAASYGNCTEPAGGSGCSGAGPGACGFRFNHNVSAFTSPDLVTWIASPSPAFQMATSGLGPSVLFCPKTLYHAASSSYVMWFNWINGTNFGQSYYAVATSPSATGPYTLVVPQVTTLANADTGDFGLFLDDDGSGYIIYTSLISSPVSHQMSVERLTSDFMASEGSAGNSGFFGASCVEAPTMFKRQGVYYAVFGQCCCYCGEGTPPTVYTATSPLGPYTAQSVLDPPAGVAPLAAVQVAAAQGQVGACTGGGQPNAAGAQQSNAFSYTDASGVQQWLWYGDRWQSAPDQLKAHDFTYWSPLTFAPDGNITAFGWVDNFTISVLPGK